MPLNAWKRRPLARWIKPVLWILLLLPLANLVVKAGLGDLGANPAETLIRGLGDWAIRLLCLALAVTPLRVGLAWPALASVRRLVGLFTAFYAFLHALAYVWLDQSWVWSDVWQDVLKRPFITVGMLALILLLAMVVTSPRAIAKRLGAARWRRLHRSVYVIAGLAVLHFFWMRAGKQNFADVWLWGSVLAALLATRLPPVRRRLQS